MAESIYPVASSNHIYYTSNIRDLNATIIKNKTILGDGLKVTALTTPSMKVEVSAGKSLYNGYMFTNTTSIQLTIASNTASYARKDAIVLRYNGANTELMVLQGTASATPTIPTVGSNDILLAEIYVGVSATAIQTSNITDKRFTTNGQHKITSLDNYMYGLESRVATIENNISTRREFNGSGVVKSIIIENNREAKIKRQYLKCSATASEWKTTWENLNAGTNNYNGAFWIGFYDAVTPSNVINASINITNFNKWMFISAGATKIGITGIGGIGTNGCYVFIENKFPNETTIGVDFTVCITEKY